MHLQLSVHNIQHANNIQHAYIGAPSFWSEFDQTYVLSSSLLISDPKTSSKLLRQVLVTAWVVRSVFIISADD